LKTQTIDKNDTLTLIINKTDGEGRFLNHSQKGEIVVNIFELYNNTKKRYMLGDDANITLKLKYIPTSLEESSDEIYSIKEEKPSMVSTSASSTQIKRSGSTVNEAKLRMARLAANI
jgi:hypothetical protein